MRLGIAADHGGFDLKRDLAARLRAAGHDVVDFGADELRPEDDYPDFVIRRLRQWRGGLDLRQQDSRCPGRADP